MCIQEKASDISELLKTGSVDGVMEFLAAYQSKLSHFDEQWELYNREQAALNEQITVLRRNASDLNPTTVKEDKTNRYVTQMIRVQTNSDFALVLYLSSYYKCYFNT